MSSAKQLEFSGGWKRCHLRQGIEPLEVTLLREGTLDVDLQTGHVFSVRGGKRTPMTIQWTPKGYAYVQLQKEKSTNRGKQYRDGDKIRYRVRRNAFVNRIVKLKSLAVAMGGSKWREHVRPLPQKVDVNHIDLNRSNNCADNLELQTEAANRIRRESQEWETDEIHRAVF